MEWILTGLGALLGLTVVWTRVSKVISALKEVTELLVKVTGALEDKTLSTLELSEIKKEAVDVAVAVKAIFQ